MNRRSMNYTIALTNGITTEFITLSANFGVLKIATLISYKTVRNQYQRPARTIQTWSPECFMRTFLNSKQPNLPLRIIFNPPYLS